MMCNDEITFAVKLVILYQFTKAGIRIGYDLTPSLFLYPIHVKLSDNDFLNMTVFNYHSCSGTIYLKDFCAN